MYVKGVGGKEFQYHLKIYIPVVKFMKVICCVVTVSLMLSEFIEICKE